MSDGVEALVAAGQVALTAGRWEEARDSFRAAMAYEETAEALLGLAEALWWLGAAQDSVEYRARAYAEFRRRRDPAQAAAIALVLSVHYRANLGNAAASDGWLARATRLIEESGTDELRGYLYVISAGVEEPGRGESLARKGLELARELENLDLELCALAEVGASLVKQGRVQEGLVSLDEAMAGSLGGEGASFDTVVFTSCNMISSCASSAEFERALQWVRAADRFTERYGCPFLYVYCRALYASVLVATGEWRRADEELETALRESSDSQPAIRALALATLAELRLAQGRIEEAERLVTGFEDQGPAAPVAAAIHLAKGNPALAAATLGRRLDVVGEKSLEGALLVELLDAAEIALGRPESAQEHGAALAELGVQVGCQTIRARGERLSGRAAAQRNDAPTARRHLEAALAIFVELGMPLEVARTRLLLAETLRRKEPEVAAAEARAALAVSEELGAAGDADAAAALLRSLGVKAARAGPKGIGTLTRREREVLVLLGRGCRTRRSPAASTSAGRPSSTTSPASSPS
jgi:tetratricopeptide (TPR) repeat protein